MKVLSIAVLTVVFGVVGAVGGTLAGIEVNRWLEPLPVEGYQIHRVSNLQAVQGYSTNKDGHITLQPAARAYYSQPTVSGASLQWGHGDNLQGGL